MPMSTPATPLTTPRLWAALALGFLAWTLQWMWPLPLQWTSRFIQAPYWWDAQLALWYLGESQHNVLQQPGHLLDGRILHPAPEVLAYSENFLLWALPGRLLTPLLGPIGALNTWMALALLTSALATYAFLRPRVQSPWAALAGALFFAYAPWRLGLLGRLQLQSTMLLPLALLAIEAALTHLTLRRWLLVFALMGAQFGLCIYYGIYLIVLAAPAALLALMWRWRPLPPRDRLNSAGSLLVAALLIGVPLAALLLPYLQIPRDMGLQRDPHELRASSGVLRDLLSSSELMRHWQGIAAHGIDQSSREPVAFPGSIPLGLSVFGAGVASVQLFRRRSGLWLQVDERGQLRWGLGVLLVWIGLCGLFFLGTGPNAPTLGLRAAFPGGPEGLYGRFFGSLPLLHGLRFTNRFVVPATLFASVLLAWGVQFLMDRAAKRRPMAGPLLGALLLVAIAAELDTRRLPLVQPPPPEAIYQRLIGDPQAGAVAELPMDGVWHTQRLERNDGARIHGLPTTGGFTGYNPPHHSFFREVLAQPTSEASQRLLQAIGANRLIIHWHWFEPGPREALRQAVAQTPWLQLLGGDDQDQLFAVQGVSAQRAAQIRREWPAQVRRELPAATQSFAAHSLIAAPLGQDPGALADANPATTWSPGLPQDADRPLLQLDFAPARICGLWFDSRRHPGQFARGLRIAAVSPQGLRQLVYEDRSRQPLSWLTQAPARSFDVVQWPGVAASSLRIEALASTDRPAADPLVWADLHIERCLP